MYNCKNYTAHGGNETIIGGKLTFLPGAQVEGLNDLLDLPEGGAVTLAANQPASTATTVTALKDDLNALLAKLKAAGLMVPDATPGE